jgi:S-adenosylmethionine:diacylglycerol 3-amino-3-carboxypropyl transferase
MNMSHLTDKQLRAALLMRLKAQNVVPRAILEEVRVHNGNAIADVVSIHTRPHCYEIKGETDEIRRIVKQGEFYDRAFQRITLVTTKNHLAAAERIAPSHWGVMVASTRANHELPALRYIRKSTDSPLFDKQVALLTLWKSELLSLCVDEVSHLAKLNRLGLTKHLAQEHAACNISSWIGEKLVNRHITNGWPVAM